jgi:hypothetical protein
MTSLLFRSPSRLQLPIRLITNHANALQQQHEIAAIPGITADDLSLVQKRSSPLVGSLNHSPARFGSTTPKVYMLGWGGSVDKQLIRYSKLYEEQGCDVSRYIAPLLKAPSLVHAHPFAAEFHSAVAANEANRPLVFHLFSMNGCMIFTALWELWGKSERGRALKERVKGIVFDR